jgi:hypothetical protein
MRSDDGFPCSGKKVGTRVRMRAQETLHHQRNFSLRRSGEGQVFVTATQCKKKNNNNNNKINK